MNKISKCSISVEMLQSATASHIKHSLGESSFTDYIPLTKVLRGSRMA